MKIDTFATLDAVLRGGSFAAAAAEMHLTAGAVSMQMKQLEAFVGEALFDRSGAQVRPTPLAHEVAASLQDGLARLQGLRRRTLHEVEGVVRLGIIESVLPALLPGTLSALRVRFPRLDLRPARGRSGELTDAVKSGELNAAVVAEPEDGGSTRLHWHRLFRREMRLLAPPASTETSVAALFRQHDWIRYDRHTISGLLAARWLAQQVPVRRGSLELDSIPGIVALVSAGLGVSIVHLVDAGITQTYPVRFVRVGRGAPAVQMSLVLRKSDAESRPLLAVREALAATLAGTARQRVTAPP